MKPEPTVVDPAAELADDLRRADVSTPFDVLLSEAALGTVRRFLPAPAVLRLILDLSLRPRSVLHRIRPLIRDVAKVTIGTSELAPARGDRRFKDQAWHDNAILLRLMQGY